MDSKFLLLFLFTCLSVTGYTQGEANNITYPLPLVWDDIQVKKGTDGNNIITWWTLPEYHVVEFIIQSSGNGYKFQAFKRVEVKDNTHFEIEDASRGNQFYRIISIDDRGMASYSKIVNVNGGLNTPVFFYDGRNTIQIQSPAVGISNICIVDVSGRVFGFSKNIINQGSIDISYLPRGMYIIEASGTNHQAKRFMKL